MKNPSFHLVGIAAPRGGGEGLFNARTEVELCQWLEHRLDALGIDSIAYSRFVLSFLRRSDSALTSPLDVVSDSTREEATLVAATTVTSGRRSKARSRTKLTLPGDKEQRRAVVQCLQNAADQKCGVESLVDELCAKLKDLESVNSRDQQDKITAIDDQVKVPFETLTPRDRALRYYAAFPALQPVTTSKKFPHWKERNFNHNNNNNSNNNNYSNNNNNNNNNKNNYNSHNCNNKKNISKSNTKNKTRQKKNKMSIQRSEPQSQIKTDIEESEQLMEQKQKEQELELDRIKLMELKAKFNNDLRSLWDTEPGIPQGNIWRASSLSILPESSWSTQDSSVSFLSMIFARNTLESPVNQNVQPNDDSLLISWESNLLNIEDCLNDSSNSKTDSFDPCKNIVSSDKELHLHLETIPNLPKPDEDLLTSDKSHFYPIKEDGNWADGTTFPIDSEIHEIAYRRSDSGNLFYLPGGKSPYMEYRESLKVPTAVAAIPSNFTLKFKVRQCSKATQTDHI